MQMTRCCSSSQHPVLILTTPVSDLFMVGKVYAHRLKNLNINTTGDLLHHYPFRWEDYRLVSPIIKLQPGEIVTVGATIVSFDNIFSRGGKRIQKMIVADSSGQIQVIFFNQIYLKKVLKPGLGISLSGKVDFFSKRLSLISPEYEIIKKSYLIHTGRLVPVYPETLGVSSKWLRSRIAPLLIQLLPKIPDWLPLKVKKYNHLIDLASALKAIHFPKTPEEAQMAKKRLAFDELFLMALQTQIRKLSWSKNKITKAFVVDKRKVEEFIKHLPFSLTGDQQKGVSEILSDLSRDFPMNRLLQGDVGSGKTVVAAIASYVSYLNGSQAALMAPTEILALQHYQTFKELLTPLGVKIGLATGSKNNLTMKQFNNETIDIFIGTHALLYGKVNFQKLGLVIIDEQHRFGVEQRAKLSKMGKNPHTLVMTATPIPRTIALTLYGDLDISLITQMPAGRRKIKTWVVPSEKRQAAYTWIRKQVKGLNSQAFIVCPLIEPSEIESMKDIKAVKGEFTKLAKEIFPDLALGLLHGRLKTGEKEKIISKFRNQKLDILVATPVVEVGIDIPRATIILIEGADRFGLASLHQLRGRVGRREREGFCLLFASATGRAYQRLKLMEKSQNGFWLSEMDLKLRGPGEVYGTSQHGFFRLKIADWSDTALVDQTSRAAKTIIPNLDQFPLLKAKLKTYTIKAIEPN